MRVFIAIATLCVTACTPSKVEETKKAVWFLKISPCASPMLDDISGWNAIRTPRGELEFRLPPSFVRTNATFVEGGAAWQRGESEFSWRYGYWSLKSVPGSVRLCRTVTHGLPVIVFSYPRHVGVSVAAWFVGSGEGQKYPMDVLMSFRASNASQARIFEAIVQTAR